MKKIFGAIVGCSALLGAVVMMTSQPTNAADHTDPPAVSGSATADIGDYYAWHSGNGATDTITVVMTVDGLKMPAAGQSGSYDPDVLYAIHFDNNNDNVADIRTYVRFAQNDLGAWGVQAVGLPGTATPLEGPVETDLVDGDIKLRAGLFDDPFFFDLDGFNATIANAMLADASTTPTLAFTGADAFAGSNITAIILEVPVSAVQGGQSGPINTWATTAEIGG